jgi:predicted nucleotidyltransferase
MRQTLKDYGYTMNQVPLLCDNESVIKIVYNPCEQSRTKNIDIQHHFLRDHAIKEDNVISHVRTNEQLADIFTNPLDEKILRELRSEVNIIHSQNVA